MAQRKSQESDDKQFGAIVTVHQKLHMKGYPHLEWDGAKFSATNPDPTPKVNVNISVMHEARRKLGVRWSGSRKGIFKSHAVEAITDTGIGCRES